MTRGGAAVIACIALAACTKRSKPITLTVDVPFTPVYFAYDLHDGAGWRAPVQSSSGTYELPDVIEELDVVVVCARTPTTFYTQELRSIRYIDPHWPAPVCVDAAAQAPIRLSGQMMEPGTLAVARSETASAVAMWSYALDLSPGTIDLVASDGAAIVIRRGLELSQPRTEPLIDVASEGSLLVDQDLSPVDHDSDEVVDTSIVLHTVNDTYATLPATTTGSKIVRGDMLVPSETQTVGVSARSATTFRTLAAEYDGYIPVDHELPERLPPPFGSTGFYGETVGGEWDSYRLPDDFALLNVVFDDGMNAQSVAATAGWIDENLADSVAFENPDGYDPAWSVNFAAAHRELSVSAVAPTALGSIRTTTGFTEDP